MIDSGVTRTCIQDISFDSSSVGKPSMTSIVERIVKARITALTARHEVLCNTENIDSQHDERVPSRQFHLQRAEKAEIETQIRSKRMLLKLFTNHNLSLDSPQLQNINWSTQDLLLLLQMNERISNELTSEKADKSSLQVAFDDIATQLACETAALQEAQARLRQQEDEIAHLKAQTQQMVATSRQLAEEKFASTKLATVTHDCWSKAQGLATYDDTLTTLQQHQFPPAKVEARNFVLSVICLSVLAVPVLCPVIVLLSPVLAPMVASYFFLKYRLQLSFFSVAFHFQWSTIAPDVHWCRKMPTGPTWRWVPYPSF